MDINLVKDFFDKLETENGKECSVNENEEQPQVLKKYKNPYEKLVGEPKNPNENTDIDDSKIFHYKNPKYAISYKQSVTTSDIFLQMSNKNPSTASCKDLIVKIDLPEERINEIDLKIHETDLELQARYHYLKLELPQKINPQLGNAKWFQDKCQLIVTLQMDREFDLINH